MIMISGQPGTENKIPGMKDAMVLQGKLYRITKLFKGQGRKSSEKLAF